MFNWVLEINVNNHPTGVPQNEIGSGTPTLTIVAKIQLISNIDNKITKMI